MSPIHVKNHTDWTRFGNATQFFGVFWCTNAKKFSSVINFLRFTLNMEVMSVLRIGSSHKNVRALWCKPCLNFTFFKFPWTYLFRSVANLNRLRYSDGTSYLKTYRSSKCNQTVCLHLDLTSILKIVHFDCSGVIGVPELNLSASENRKFASLCRMTSSVCRA